MEDAAGVFFFGAQQLYQVFGGVLQPRVSRTFQFFQFRYICGSNITFTVGAAERTPLDTPTGSDDGMSQPGPFH